MAAGVEPFVLLPQEPIAQEHHGGGLDALQPPGSSADAGVVSTWAPRKDDSFDDICNQIRMLRAVGGRQDEAVLRRHGAAGRGALSRTPSVREMVPSAGSPSASSGLEGLVAASAAAGVAAAAAASRTSTLAVPSPSATQFRTGGAARHAETSLLGPLSPAPAHSSSLLLSASAGSSRSPALRTPGGAGGGRLAQHSPLVDAMSRSPLGARQVLSARQLTLWEERQLARCFGAWRLPWRLDSVNATAFSGVAPSTPAEQAPSSRTSLEAAHLLEPCFRVWRRAAAEFRAQEIALSVQLINVQVVLSLRRGLARWQAMLERRVAKRDAERARVSEQRQALRRWHCAIARRVLDRTMADQAMAVVRLGHLRRSLRRWAEMAPALRTERRDASSKKLERQKEERRAALKWWADYAKSTGRCRRAVQKRRGESARALQVAGLQHLSRYAKSARTRSQQGQVAQRHARHRVRAAVLRAWWQWSSRRRRRRTTLQRHITTRANPRLEREVFQHWVAHVRREQRQEAALRRAGVVTALYLKGRTFHGWSAICRAAADSKARLARSAQSALEALVTTTFTSWRDLVGLWVAHHRQIDKDEVDRQASLCGKCLRVLHDYSLLRRRKAERKAWSRGLAAAALLAKATRAWRSAATAEQRERHRMGLAAGHFERRTLLRRVAAWRRVVLAGREEQSRLQAAARRWTGLQLGRSLASWLRYLASRRGKRHLAKGRRCAEASGRARRRAQLRGWSRLSLAIRTGQRLRHASASRLARSFFAWHSRLVTEGSQGQHVLSTQRRRCAREVLAAWAAVQAASNLRRASHERHLLHKSLAAWRLCMQETQAEAAERVAEGLLLQQRRLLLACLRLWYDGVLAWQDLRSRTELLVASLVPLAELCRWQALDAGLGALSGWAEEVRAREEAELLTYCFHGWALCQRRQMHKRSVHLLCAQFRAGHALRRAFAAWLGAHGHAEAVAAAVLQWAATVATQRVASLLHFWHVFAASERKSRQVELMLEERRRVATLHGWRGALVRKLAITGFLWHKETQRARAWVLAWKERVAIWSIKRRLDNASMEMVRQVRQRRWIDQWSEAGTWQRMAHVAAAWDGQVVGPQLLQLALQAWSATMALYTRAEKVTRRFNIRRGWRVVRGWGKLLRATAQRPRQQLRQAMAAWRRAHSSFLESRVRLERLEMRGALGSFRQLAAYRDYRRRRRQWFEEQCVALHHRRVLLQRGGALRWWHFSSRELRRERALEARHVVADPAAEAQKRELVQRLGQRRAFARWREVKLHLIAETFVARRPHLLGQAALRPAFYALAYHRQRRRGLRVKQDFVSARLQHALRAKFLDEWVKVYEHEASTYYAGQILQRWRLSRIMAAWFRLSGFRRRFDSHLAEVQGLRNGELLRQLMLHWVQRLRTHRLVAALWLERRRHWSAALLRAWQQEVFQCQALRYALRQMGRAAKFRRSRRAAGLMELSLVAGVLRRCVTAWARWRERAAQLRAHTGAFVRSIVTERQRRRLCSWIAQSRAHEEVWRTLGTAFAAWAAAHGREVALSRGLARLDAQQRGSLLIRTFLPWFRWASDRRSLRDRANGLATGRAGRRRWGTLRTWHNWARLRSQHKHAVRRFYARIEDRLLRPRFAAWRRMAGHARAIARHSAAKSYKRAWTCFHLWSLRAAATAVGRSRGAATCRRLAARLALRAARAWLARGRRAAGLRRLAEVASRSDERWVSEEHWRARALRDPALRAIFNKFASAFDQHRSEPSILVQQAAGRRSLAEGGTFEALVSLIWARQQLTVALERLRGSWKPWVLAAWPAESLPLLSPNMLYFRQAEARLARMVVELEGTGGAGQLQIPGAIGGEEAAAPAGRRPREEQRALMWRALADLLVVHHPGWPARGSGALGSALVARHDRAERVARHSGHPPLPYHAGVLDQHAHRPYHGHHSPLDNGNNLLQLEPLAIVPSAQPISPPCHSDTTGGCWSDTTRSPLGSAVVEDDVPRFGYVTACRGAMVAT